MGILQQEFDRVMQELCTNRKLMELMFRHVAKQKGVELKDTDVEKLVDALSKHKGPEDSFSVELDIETPITITPADVEEALKGVEGQMADHVEKAIATALEHVPPDILRSLYADAPAALKDRREMLRGFEGRLVDRWGEGLDRLEMLIMIAQEAGGTFVEDMHLEDADELSEEQIQLVNALIGLHARACRCASEVICLMKGGFADGANARWRSLHEVTVTALFLLDHQGDTSERYLEYAAVERLCNAKEYQRHCEVLGYEPFADKDIDEMTRAVDAVVAKYGKDFKNKYGWAAKVLGKSDPTFAQIEESLDMSEWRPFYKLACHSVHAGSQGLMFSLAIPQGSDIWLLPGASDAGLCDPGQQTAVSLSLATIALLTSIPNLDRLVTCRCMHLLTEDIKDSLFEAHESLAREVQLRFGDEHLDGDGIVETNGAITKPG